MNDQQDMQAAAALWEQYRKVIGRSLASYEADAALRQDLGHNVFLALLHSVRRVQAAANPRAYLLRIVHNVATDHVCREARHQWVELDSEPASQLRGPEQQLLEQAAQDSLMQAVRSLALPYRQVVVLLLEDFAQAEIAEILGLSEGNVRVRLNRARGMLKAALGRGGET